MKFKLIIAAHILAIAALLAAMFAFNAWLAGWGT